MHILDVVMRDKQSSAKAQISTGTGQGGKTEMAKKGRS